MPKANQERDLSVNLKKSNNRQNKWQRQLEQPTIYEKDTKNGQA